MDTWAMIGAERAALVEALETLAPEDWDQPTLCAGWSVRDLVAHIDVAACQTPARFLKGMAVSGFRFNTMVEKDIRTMSSGKAPADLVDVLRSRVATRNGPPGPELAMLGEVVVHGEDIFRSLGSYRHHPVAHVVAVADFYKGSNLLTGTKKRISGLTLRATDADWSHGIGPEVTGPMIALVLAMSGRRLPLDDLKGDGVAIMGQRG